jgi:hypothetical protein
MVIEKREGEPDTTGAVVGVKFESTIADRSLPYLPLRQDVINADPLSPA